LRGATRIGSGDETGKKHCRGPLGAVKAPRGTAMVGARPVSSGPASGTCATPASAVAAPRAGIVFGMCWDSAAPTDADPANVVEGLRISADFDGMVAYSVECGREDVVGVAGG